MGEVIKIYFPSPSKKGVSELCKPNKNSHSKLWDSHFRALYLSFYFSDENPNYPYKRDHTQKALCLRFNNK